MTSIPRTLPRRLRRLLTLAAVALAAGCGQQEPEPPAPTPAAVFRFAWLAECHTQLEKRFELEKQAHPGFSVEWVAFGRSLPPTPTLKGYVELRSTAHTNQTLGAVADDVIASCYPSSVRKLTLRDRRFVAKLDQTREIAAGMGAKRLYSRLSDHHLHVYFPGRHAAAP